MKILALETSTSSAKAMYYDTKDTNKMKISSIPLTDINDEFATQNMEKVFDKLIKVGTDVLEGRRVDIVSLGGTWHSVALMDRKSQPSTPAYLWNFHGASEICSRLRRDNSFTDEYYKSTGCMVNSIYPFFKLLYLQSEGYELSNYLISGQGVYNTFMLTGEYVVTECTASGTGLLDLHKLSYNYDYMEMLKIKKGNLPEIIKSNKILKLSPKGASLLGLESGTPVIASNSDGGLNQVGSGALENGDMTISVGTSGALRVSVDRPVLSKERENWCYRSPYGYLAGAATSGACNCLDWFRNNIANGKSYESLEREKNDTPTFLPFLFGERCPGWNDKRYGGFFDLKPDHDESSFYVAIQEGILFNLFQCYESLVNEIDKPERVVISGGITYSSSWLQMAADIFGFPIEVDEQTHSSLIGSVKVAIKALGEELEAQVNDKLIITPRHNNYYRDKYIKYLYYYNKLSEEVVT